MPEVSQIHLHIPAANVRPLPASMVKSPSDVAKLGFGFRKGMNTVREMAQMYAADSVQSGVTTPAIPGLVQFLQTWLPGQVAVMTAAREIDDIIGITTVGSWADEQVVQEVLENLAFAKDYGDYTNVPLADWNLTFEFRTVVRFEMGLRVGILEEERSARVRVNSAQSKRESCGLGLEIVRNLVGFNGYNSGNGKTYGFLNDPGLPAYVTVANGAASSPLWSLKTFLEICQDIRTGIVALRTQSKGVINPSKVPLTLAVGTNAIDYLSKTSDFGISVWDWLKQAYPNIRVANAPQLSTANGGVGVFYLFADRIADLSTDGGRVFDQLVPNKFMALGVVKLAKGFEEDYSNATAGVMCKRPWAVVRYSGIS